MNNNNVRNLIRFIGVVFFISFLFSLSFTFVVNREQKKAVEFSNGDYNLEQYYLDSVSTEPVYTPWLFFGQKSWTLSECQDSELKLGLDLQGGMNVTLEISMRDILIALSDNSQDPIFNQALKQASEQEINSQEDYLALFETAFKEVDINGSTRLSDPRIFGNKDLRDKIPTDASNEEVMRIIRIEAEGAVDRAFTVLRARIDKFGVAQPSIQKAERTGRIIVELPGVKDVVRVKKLLQSAAVLEFWETYDNTELFNFMQEANFALNEKNISKDSSQNLDDDLENILDDGVDNLDDLVLDDDVDNDTLATSTNVLFYLLSPNISIDPNTSGLQIIPGPVVGSALIKDTSKINNYLIDKDVLALIPNELRNVKFLWEAKPFDEKNERLRLIAIKSNREDKAKLAGDVIVDASQDIDQFGNPQINMRMNRSGARLWQKITRENIGNSVAVVLDDYVYSFPTVNAEISGGSSVISGNFTLDEAQDLANILKAGKLPAPAKIIQSEIVGPSLGSEAIQAGYKSFLIALAFVLFYMIFYYMHAGLASNVALIINMFFIFGALSGLGGVLTLPGIAGIVLTIGMSVDANVLIYERIREEIYQGKGLTLAIRDGYTQAYSSIIDANITTLLTGVVLFYFGTGPIKGFATTLIIGILTSLFCAIFITRLIFESRINSKKSIRFSNFITHNAFKNLNIRFIPNRKRYYVLSALIIGVGIFSLFTKGLNQGVDFQGGRTYIVRFEQPVVTSDLRNTLGEVFVTENNLKLFPEVKTFGNSNQVKITTNYMINDLESDTLVEQKLYEGLVSFSDNQANKLILDSKTGAHYFSSQLVGPTIADDIKKSAVWSILFSLVLIFLYILFRFKKWQYSLGAVIAVFHDVMILLSIFSVFYGILPFSLEIDQAFIAAVLTVIGYSLNDTVVVFDRIREYVAIKVGDSGDVINRALNSTLSRTINTSLTTFFVLFVIFVFGGEMVRGFMFAIMTGVIVGTYSSLFIASPIMYDTTKKKLN
ncbi:MAG: protein translocase subunit SecDF [Flavobacteriales bacterium]|nr:protein translocase subunit SecDF [Flavobacteriales bacterium]